ncbi:MAG: methylenetetrahydrofolate reductase, partial [Bacillota bacterium]|nr:methylenetetrahydrofolate reductase [Bacillota bacterium]
FLITQMFFDNGLFYEFREKLDLLGVNIPVTAGIMPVINKKQIEKITSLCGASLPAKFKRILWKYENNPEALKQAGIVYATEQIIDLLAEGVDGIHLYTMNKPEVAKKIFENFDSIRQSEDSQCSL